MTADSPIPFDPREWHNIQPPEVMDVSRRFEYDDDALLLLRKWLRLDASKEIVEVGSGSGFFTEKLLMMSPQSEIICVEPDEVLRKYAERKLKERVSFIKGTAEEIPLPSDYSDLAVCHIVLNNLPDVSLAVREMVRVTKRGGIVAAVEPFGRGVSYNPDRRLDETNPAADEAFGKGVWELRKRLMVYPEDKEDRQTHYPEIFSEAGLRNIEAHGLLSVFLLSDPRRRTNDLVNWLQSRLDLLEKDGERLALIQARGGADQELTKEFLTRNKEYIKNLLRNPKKIAATHELESVGRIVVVGFKL